MSASTDVSMWTRVDMETRKGVSIPDGYDLRAVDLEDLGWTVTYRRRVEGGYDVDDELVYLVSGAGTLRA